MQPEDKKCSLWNMDKIQPYYASIMLPQILCQMHMPQNVRVSTAASPSLYSAPPVFDRLQYAKTEGEGLGNLLT